ncbi:MAG: NADH-quinone oxidoreductase subunit J [Chloroflexi bacterium]|nr:NADH-quinone oxidoreductase subunit J [Chloroflexota bacterium]
MAQTVLFWALAVAAVASAVAVVTMRNILRAAVMLAVSFLAVAGLFVLLNADFLAVVQVLIYVGAVSVLLVFAVLLTGDAQAGSASNRLRVPGAMLSVLLLAALGAVALRTDWALLEGVAPGTFALVQEVLTETPQQLADLLLSNWSLPFEVASVLLLAAIVGALVLVRERHP